jgi:hypothetical protein
MRRIHYAARLAAHPQRDDDKALSIRDQRLKVVNGGIGEKVALLYDCQVKRLPPAIFGLLSIRAFLRSTPTWWTRSGSSLAWGSKP